MIAANTGELVSKGDSVETRRAVARDEGIRMSYRHLPNVVAASVATAAVAAVVVRGHVPTDRLVGWVGSLLALSLARLVLWRAFNARARSHEELGRWLWYLGLSLSAGALVFGGLVLLSEGQPDLLVIATGSIIVPGMLAGGAQSLIATPQILVMMSVIAMTPLTFVLVDSDIPGVRPFGVMVFLFLASMTATGRQNWRALQASLALRFENLDLAERLAKRSEAAEEARSKAEVARRDKNRFVAAASHDLRQPMHALRLFVAALRNQPQTPRGTQLLAGTVSALEPLSHLIEGLLELSRLEAGAIPAKPSVVSVSTLAASLEAMFASAATERGLSLRVVAPEGLAVDTDPVLVGRILQNLVGNAIRYTERGRVLVCFRRRGQRVLAQVWDTGVGIPEDEQTEIFGAFHRLEGASGSEGVGLGLAVVAGLAELLGVPVRVRSALGRGSVFELELPAVSSESVSLPSARAPIGHRHLTLLVVDDDPLVREGLAAVLESWGYRVLTARGVEHVAELLERERTVDGLVVDWSLSAGETSLDVLEVVEAGLGATPPTLIVTGESDAEVLARARATGHTVLHKPVAPAALRAALVDALGASPAPRPSSEQVST